MEGGWLCIFGAFLEGCIVWRLLGLGVFSTFGMWFPNLCGYRSLFSATVAVAGLVVPGGPVVFPVLCA